MLRESILQGLGSPYPSWVFDRGTTKSDSFQGENPAGMSLLSAGGAGSAITAPLRGCSDLAAWPTGKILHHSAAHNFQTDSKP